VCVECARWVREAGYTRVEYARWVLELGMSGWVDRGWWLSAGIATSLQSLRFRTNSGSCLGLHCVFVLRLLGSHVCMSVSCNSLHVWERNAS